MKQQINTVIYSTVALCPDNYSLWQCMGGWSGRYMLSAVWDVLLWHQDIKRRHEMWVTKSALDLLMTVRVLAHAEVLCVLQDTSASMCVYVCGLDNCIWSIASLKNPTRKKSVQKPQETINVLLLFNCSSGSFCQCFLRVLSYFSQGWKCNQAPHSENIKTSHFWNYLDYKLTPETQQTRTQRGKGLHCKSFSSSCSSIVVIQVLIKSFVLLLQKSINTLLYLLFTVKIWLSTVAMSEPRRNPMDCLCDKEIAFNSSFNI